MTIQIKFILIFTLLSNAFSHVLSLHLISELRNPSVGYPRWSCDGQVTDMLRSGDPYPAQRWVNWGCVIRRRKAVSKSRSLVSRTIGISGTSPWFSFISFFSSKILKFKFKNISSSSAKSTKVNTDRNDKYRNDNLCSKTDQGLRHFC